MYVSLALKGKFRTKKNFLALVLVVQNISFPETYNAYTFLSLDSWCDRFTYNLPVTRLNPTLSVSTDQMG